MLYRQIKLRRGLPFAVEMPNALTAKTLRESKGRQGRETVFVEEGALR